MLTHSILQSVETPNLILREFCAEDRFDLAGFMTQSRYQKYISHKLKDLDEVTEFVRRQVGVQGDGRRRVYHLAAEERISCEVVGDGFLINHQDHALELGWGIHPALWSMGFGTEIGRALLGVGFERLMAKSMWCKIMSGNKRSARLATRIGLQLIKTDPAYHVGPGRMEQVDIYSITAEQYFDLPY
jgi:[ribosomal protein S5]-alanine N-acetyltransferase